MKPFSAELAETYPDLVGYCRGIARSSVDGDDLAQATCLRALEKADQFEPGTNMRSWLYVIAKRLWIDRARRQQRWPQLDIEDPSVDAALPARPAPQDDTVMVREVSERFGYLSEEQQVVVYGIARGNSYEQIAEAMQVPLGTIRSKLFRARKVLEGAT